MIDLEVNDGIAQIGARTPVLSVPTIRALLSGLERLERMDPPPKLILSSRHPRIFLAGAHLGEIADLNPSTSIPYARLGRSLVSRIETYPAPTVAAVDGACRGGGVDLIFACDSITVGARATIAHPGVSRGLVTGWSGTSTVAQDLGHTHARSVFVEASELGPDAVRRAGLIVCSPDQTAIDVAVVEIRRLAILNPQRITLWRSLKRGDFVDRFRASMILNG